MFAAVRFKITTKKILRRKGMNTKQMALACILTSLMIFSQGCYTLNQVGTATDTGIEITNTESATSISKFTKSKWVNHFVFGLVSPSDSGVEQLIADAVKTNGGAKAVNVKMKYQYTFVNGLVGAITFGIYTPFTLTVEGDVVK
jgi:hypothetical protein